MVTKYDILDMYNVFTNIKHQSHNLRLDLMSFFLNTKSKNEKKTKKKCILDTDKYIFLIVCSVCFNLSYTKWKRYKKC